MTKHVSRANYFEGATPAERIALFNCADSVFICRDAGESGALVWQVFAGDVLRTIGVRSGNDFRTLREAESYARREFPSLPLWRVFLARVEGDGRKARLLWSPSLPLSELDEGERLTLGDNYRASLALDSQDIRAALFQADRQAMAWHGIAPGDVSGVVEIAHDSGIMAAVYATTSQRPYALESIYRRVL